MPTTPEALEAEREARLERQTRESVESGHAEWEVRIELPDHERRPGRRSGSKARAIRSCADPATC